MLLCASSPPIRDPEVEKRMKEMRVAKEKAEKENRKLKKQLQVRPRCWCCRCCFRAGLVAVAADVVDAAVVDAAVVNAAVVTAAVEDVVVVTM